MSRRCACASATLVLVDRSTARAAAAALAAAARAAWAGGRRVVVGWSFLSAESDVVAQELAAVRAALPPDAALHVAGGAHASAEPAAALAMGFDLAARGEGEATIVALLARVLAGE